jgi:hypothetical protein
VTSECYCPIEVTWDGGNGTVNAWGNDTFVFTEDTYVFLTPETGCCSYQWYLDGELQGFEFIMMDKDYSVRCVCSNECY